MLAKYWQNLRHWVRVVGYLGEVLVVQQIEKLKRSKAVEYFLKIKNHLF